jgi:hypothetical protein
MRDIHGKRSTKTFLDGRLPGRKGMRGKQAHVTRQTVLVDEVGLPRFWAVTWPMVILDRARPPARIPNGERKQLITACADRQRRWATKGRDMRRTGDGTVLIPGVDFEISKVPLRRVVTRSGTSTPRH